MHLCPSLYILFQFPPPSFRARGWDAFTNVRWYCESASWHSSDKIPDDDEDHDDQGGPHDGPADDVYDYK